MQPITSRCCFLITPFPPPTCSRAGPLCLLTSCSWLVAADGTPTSSPECAPLGSGSSNLPDVTAADFEQVNLSQYKWIHWEGRNASEQVKMLRRVEEHNRTCLASERVTTSVEVEKPRSELYQLFSHGDVVFVSKDVAKALGFSSASGAVKGLRGRLKPGATIICAWAEQGADAMGPDGTLLHSDAFSPREVVDTLGAGDTFNAAVILALSRGSPLSAALAYGCQVAGRKCGVHGYDGIV